MDDVIELVKAGKIFEAKQIVHERMDTMRDDLMDAARLHFDDNIKSELE